MVISSPDVPLLRPCAMTHSYPVEMDLVWLSLGGNDLTQYLLVIIQNELVALMIGLRDHAKLLSDVVMSFCWRSEPRMMGLTKVLDNIPLQSSHLVFPAPNIRPRRLPGPEPGKTPDKMGAFFARSGSLARTSGDRHRDAGIHYHTATRCDTNWRSSGSVMPLALFEPTRRRIRGRRETLAPSEPDALLVIAILGQVSGLILTALTGTLSLRRKIPLSLTARR
ncbi:uncharacterized protein BO96DRAFT_372013 [Aspergillus niger CBS 101883]|uniref:uncharacterized protein n=1 Tax=Aspergillus lacticoffeatus (strain CBS 101883) TaxID=1450533 RepID=UPI000D802A1D|nr:uncharacterized protein BO96DRAFT_372013 [Aspergillus niger CBS 101883]PYH53987.1 hypothetical protein BO96DRAFT_372013 [Aspergillus niger CBS 101883]